MDENNNGKKTGLGCAGRGIITALEKLKELGAYDVYKPDVVFPAWILYGLFTV